MNRVSKPSQCIIAGVLGPAQAGETGRDTLTVSYKWAGEGMWSSQSWFGEWGAELGKDWISVLWFGVTGKLSWEQ